MLGAALVLVTIAIGPVLAAVPSSHHPGRILVMPRPDVPGADLAAFHAAAGGRVLRQFHDIENLQVIGLPAGAKAPEFVQRYTQSGLVRFAELDQALALAVSPNDPSYANGSLWHLHNFGQSGGVADADIDAPEAWDTLRTASNVVVAVVDTGIRYTHEDLAANIWVNPGEIPGNGLDDDGDGYIDNVHGINAAANNGNPIDVLGHGTQVAGFIGAIGNNGVGVSGVAWRVKLMACRFYDDAGNGYLTDAIQAIDFARAKGAQVINASFISTGYSSSFYSAINSCRNAGIVFVAAAGNDTINNDVTPYYPASFNLDNIVAVAATTRTDALATFSNYGATSVDLAAPGETLLTTYYSADNAYAWNSGTSFASPITAGACALLRARYPSATYREIIDRLLSTVDPLPGLAGKCVSGGRLNLARALGPSLGADFTASPAVGTVPMAVRFTNTSFGTITNILWDFGDGATSAEVNPVHVYSTPGNFTARLTVAGGNGATSTTNRAILAALGYQMTNAPFAWIDPASMPSLGVSGDGVSAAQSLPFTFRFFGQARTSVWVGANGLLGFDSTGLNIAANTDLPEAAAPNNILCPYWDDLNPSSTSVRFGVVGTAPGRKAVVSWVNAAGAGAGPPASFTFQVVLEETTDRILFQYLEVQPSSNNGRAAGRSATVGIEHPSGLIARRFSFNGSTLLANQQAILFTPDTTGDRNFLNAAPTVLVTSPTNDATLTAPATFVLSATATDDTAVAKVEFFRGATWLGEDLTSPYSLTVSNLGTGTHLFTAVATDTAGASATNAVSVNVVLAPPAPVALTPTLSPGGGFQFSFPTESGRIYRVEFTDRLPPAWQLLTNVTGDGGLKTVISSAVPSPQRFFRVETQ